MKDEDLFELRPVYLDESGNAVTNGVPVLISAVELRDYLQAYFDTVYAPAV